MDLVGFDTDTAENFENLSAIKPEEIITTPSNMGIRRHEQRHSPSLENLFSNRDGKTLFLMLESFVAGLRTYIRNKSPTSSSRSPRYVLKSNIHSRKGS